MQAYFCSQSDLHRMFSRRLVGISAAKEGCGEEEIALSGWARNGGVKWEGAGEIDQQINSIVLLYKKTTPLVTTS